MLAAQLCAVGLDGVAVLHGVDDAERLSLVAMADALAELRANEREDLAVRIVNALKKAL